MNVTRELEDGERRSFKRFCEFVAQEDQEPGEDENVLYFGLDPMKAMSVTNLLFDEAGKSFLWEIYDIVRDNASEQPTTLVSFYQ